MKKVILVVLLALSLQGSEFLCKDAHNRAYKHHKAYNFAFERMDKREMITQNKMEIYYAEKALVECGEGWHLYGEWVQWRLDLIEVGKKLKKL